jgi:ketosteroid isomerase-like protein
MSGENLEVVRQIYAAFARGDLAAILDVADSSITCHDRPDRPGRRVYTGHAGLLEFTESDRDVFDNVRYEPSDFIAVGDHVVVPLRQSGRGKASGVPVAEGIVNVWKLRGGKCLEMRVYSTVGEAFEAVGLRE